MSKQDPYAPYREELKEKAPPQHWRSLEHLNNDASVASTMDAEMPTGITKPDGFSRREALKLSGASVALGGLAGCDILRRPEEEILPFTKMPEQVIPGVPLHYATAMPRSVGAVGLVVEANDGRPTKIEGNPNHPSSLGGSDVWAQAEVLKLYDPDRARGPLQKGKPSTWTAFDEFANDLFAQARTAGGKGLAILAEENDSPTFERLMDEVAFQLPRAKVFRYDPMAPDHTLLGAEMAFAPGVRAHYDLKKASVIFALDSDFLIQGPDSLRLAREFGERRAATTKEDVKRMNRLYVAEGVFSSTGANADHRFQVSSGQGADLMKALARELSKNGVSTAGLEAGLEGKTPDGADKFLAALAKDLAKHNGECVIIVGERQSAAVHALAHALNTTLAATVTYTQKPNARARKGQAAQLTELTKALSESQVDTLVVFDANPAYTAPGTMMFGAALSKAKTVIHVGVTPDETGMLAHWHVPAAHFLESWGDARAWNGTASIVQPLILPIFGSRASVSTLAQILGKTERGDRKLVEETWRSSGQALNDAKTWRHALHDGVIAHSGYPKASPALQLPAVTAGMRAEKTFVPDKSSVETAILFGNVLDGRLANLSWQQELPDNMSKLCWDNALLISPALAQEMGIKSAVYKNGYNADLVDVVVNGVDITVPTFVLPGMAKYTTAIAAGYGKTWGEVAKGVGVNAYPILGADGLVTQGVTLKRTGKTVQLCSTQDHFSVPVSPFKRSSPFASEPTFADLSGHTEKDKQLGLGGRPLLLTGTAAEYEKKGGEFAKVGEIPEEALEAKAKLGRPALPIQLTDGMVYEGQQWGMAIDLSRCIGCNACAVACVAENNVPAVGREQVLLGREMHWLRVDRYFTGPVDTPKAVHQPIACQHCENAPCEPVCPVGATTHDEEGINAMAYNRCIGTRYCSNNCPFKVRRFNYLDFTASGNFHVDPVEAERMKSLKLQRNPNVTVRYRGVMEKCTYCTQRVEEAKISAKRHDHDRKSLPDGAVTPACAQACPTQAITFGNINDPAAKVTQLKQSDRNYEMLQELNIRPRTTFLAQLKNENEELA